MEDLSAPEISISKPVSKPLENYSNSVIDDEDGDTFRAVYTVRFAGVIYVLHAFQKKSKKGIETPKRDISVIQARLKAAEAHYRENYGKGGKK